MQAALSLVTGCGFCAPPRPSPARAGRTSRSARAARDPDGGGLPAPLSRFTPPASPCHPTYFGLYALQHRGPGIGLASPCSNGAKIRLHKDMGLVSQVFRFRTCWSACPAGPWRIGHKPLFHHRSSRSAMPSRWADDPAERPLTPGSHTRQSGQRHRAGRKARSTHLAGEFHLHHRSSRNRLCAPGGRWMVVLGWEAGDQGGGKPVPW